jgi:hypothetical protein
MTASIALSLTGIPLRGVEFEMHAACRLIFNSGQHLDDAFISMFNISTWTAQLHAKDHHSDLPRVIEKKNKAIAKAAGVISIRRQKLWSTALAGAPFSFPYHKYHGAGIF